MTTTRKARVTIAVLSSLIAYLSINSLIRAINPNAFVWSTEDSEESRWIATSRSWLDRRVCRFFGLCGTSHLRLVKPTFGVAPRPKQRSHPPLLSSTLSEDDDDDQEEPPWRAFWSSGAGSWDEGDPVERSLREIPDYVYEYAPYVYLSSHEQFWPGDIAEHLYHTTPMLNYTPIQSHSTHAANLSNLHRLNQYERGWNVFLASDDNVEERPPWLEGVRNIPKRRKSGGGGEEEEPWADWDGRVDGSLPDSQKEQQDQWALADIEPTTDEFFYDDKPQSEMEALAREADRIFQQELRRRAFDEEKVLNASRAVHGSGHSNAPAVLVVVDKGNGIIDAFWFYFYSFNLGNSVFNVRFGNHIGDWEHCLMRFYHGKPKALFFSAHAAGEAYSYEAVEKMGRRPVIYSAVGSHAMYPTAGTHAYILPLGLLHDETDRGPLWDPSLNSHAYTYNYVNHYLRASTRNPSSPTAWFSFNGHWGDKFYPLGDSRQYRLAGQYHYVNGPLGPRFKSLSRRKMCQGSDDDPCVIKDWIDDSKRPKRWVAVRENE